MTLFLAALVIVMASLAFGLCAYVAEHGPRETFDRMNEWVWK